MSSCGSGHGRVEKGDYNAFRCASGILHPADAGETHSFNCCRLSEKERHSSNGIGGWGGGFDRCYSTRDGSFYTSSA